jgi:hypothetical protein
MWSETGLSAFKLHRPPQSPQRGGVREILVGHLLLFNFSFCFMGPTNLAGCRDQCAFKLAASSRVCMRLRA